jgi:dTDP-glucose 4,6-dehydratase
MSETPRFEPRRILVTGGAGFIGSNLARLIAGMMKGERRDGPAIEALVVLDAFTYAGHRVNLAGLEVDPRFHLVEGDICDRATVEEVFAEHRIDAVFHLAAESHVDRSIEAAGVFVQTNVLGTVTLLEVARRAWEGRFAETRFVHVSTDEVFGALGPTGHFSETTPYAPNSPYAASKAGSDLMVRSYFQTYAMPVVVTNCCNNYGPYQLPEKLIPLMITNAATGKPLPVYGKGEQRREWLHVEDHCTGLWAAMTRGQAGESYCFGSSQEISNLEMVHTLADLVDAELGRPAGTARQLLRFVTDRKGHDFRYAIDSSKARRELGWRADKHLEHHLRETVRWYLASTAWRQAVESAEHRRFQRAYYAEPGAAAAKPEPASSERSES